MERDAEVLPLEHAADERINCDPDANGDVRASLPVARYLLLCAGVATMFAPTFYHLVHEGAWATSEYGHGPLILAISVWLIWRELSNPRHLHKACGTAGATAWGYLAVSCIVYIAGGVLRLDYLETLSFVGVAMAVILFIGGKALLIRLRFPLAFMLFMIPLPNSVAGSISNLVKPLVATAAVAVLALCNYPVGQGGATIVIGQYQLLVADACAGMHNLMMLEALGVLYLYLVRSGSFARDLTLALLIIPVSFVANVVRVISLALITYYYGEEMGEGFLHKFAGTVMFVSALIAVLSADSLIRFLIAKLRRNPCTA